MKYKAIQILIVLFLSNFFLKAQDTIKVMHYNLMYYGKNVYDCTSATNNVDDKNYSLKKIIQYVQPDIFSVNELDGESAYPIIDDAAYLLENALNIDTVSYYRKADFPEIYLANTIFYNSNKLRLKKSQPISFYYGGLQKIFNVYQFYYNADDLSITNDTAYIYCAVAHLKAGSGTTEEMQRAYETSLIMDYFETLGEEGNYLILGDFNLYTPTEEAFQNLINPDNSLYTFYDPADQIGEWSSNYDYRLYHTQSTHTSGDCFSLGGMDDRFDFILASDYIMSGIDHFKYISDSYKTIGQDGSRYNQSLNTTSNSAVPNDVAGALYNMSDHLPVYLELEIDQNRGEPLANNFLENNIQVKFNNPAKENLNIEIIGMHGEISFMIYSVNGDKVYESAFQEQELLSKKIDIRDFIDGIYILKISDQDKLIYTSKILIQNNN